MTPPVAPGDWQRLDPKILLIDPVKAFRQFVIPAAAAVIGIGTQQPRWLLLATPVIILGLLLAGTVPWLTTRFRIADGQLVVRRGLLNKRRLTAPLDRIRTVDLEASLLHRLLSLERVQVGTGVDDSRIELDALSSSQAGELRRFLLARSAVADVPLAEGAAHDQPGTPAAPSPAPAATELARIDYAWLRFAPFSLARLVIVAATLGALSQFADDLPIFNADNGRALLDWFDAHSLVLLVPLLLLGFVVAWVLIAVAGYAMQWWDMRLVREQGNLQLTRGLFTTNSTTMEEARIRGVELVEPILLRQAHGAELKVLATGLEQNMPPVLPPCPTAVAVRVGDEVLGTHEPMLVPMSAHGPAARRRCHVRNQWATLLLACGLVVALVWLAWPWWTVLAVLAPVAALGAGAAEQEYRHLGHALTNDHLVAGSGGLSRIRTVLEREGIIGWVVSQSWFQRRRGLATLVATTAAGAEKVTVADVPLDVAVALADRTTPGMLTDFLA